MSMNFVAIARNELRATLFPAFNHLPGKTIFLRNIGKEERRGSRFERDHAAIHERAKDNGPLHAELNVVLHRLG